MNIIRPIITEKSLTLAGKGWFTFAVLAMASKPAIAQEISGVYKVNVIEVRTISMHGKVRRVGRYSRHTKQPDWKKAMVRLKAGQKIDVFEVTGTEESGGKKT